MFLRHILLLLLGLIALRTATAALDEPTELRDLHYGEALYQLYQQNYFHAIVRLLSAKKQGYMEEYGDEPDLLLGGLYLAYGMPDEAESLFQRVLNRSASPQIHDKAWLQLAKTRYRRDQQAAAANAISQIGDALPKTAATERQVFQGLINLEQSDNNRALQSLADLPRKGEWSRYGRYNQAIALLRMNQVEAGLKILKELGSTKADSAEMKALRDRANLIRGYLLLEAKQPADAKAALQQIRLSSLATNQALLGVGWASLLQDDPQGALAPWQELASRDARDPAVLEVMLAIPYALSQLQADDQSLHYYREGIDRFSQELNRLDQAIAAIQRGELLVSLQDTED